MIHFMAQGKNYCLRDITRCMRAFIGGGDGIFLECERMTNNRGNRVHVLLSCK